MFQRNTLNLCCKIVSNKRSFHKTLRVNRGFENPIWRTIRILTEDLKINRQITADDHARALSREFPRQADVVIIGGGAIGTSIAYWLKEKTNLHGIRVVVLEKDPTYKQCSTTLSVGGLRQQFSLTENIQLSLYGAEFIRTLKKRFGKDANVNFTPHGYLVLADEENAAELVDNSKLQRDLGAANVLLSKEGLKKRFPWMDVSDVELGCLGLEKEGWFDSWSLLNILRSNAAELGTQFIGGEAVDFLFSERRDILVEGVDAGYYEALNSVVVKLPDGQQKTIDFAYCILAAGAETLELAHLAKIGVGAGMLSVPLPLDKRKRFVYSFTCPEDPPGLNTPMTLDYSSTYFRRDGLGGTFVCGASPLAEDECLSDAPDAKTNFFNEIVKPSLTRRVPAFKNLKLGSAWSGQFEHNYYDENGIIGPHPYYHNLYIATGFSGHGIQQAPGVGRSVAELILDGNFQTIDLTRLGFDRFIVNKPMYEIGTY